MRKSTLEIGEYSSGTLRPQDLLPVMLDALSGLKDCPEYEALLVLPFGAIPAHAQEDEEAEWWTSEECQWIMEEAFDALTLYCPPFCYWGSSEGDGSSIGVWIYQDAIDEAIYDGDIIVDNDCDPKHHAPTDWQAKYDWRLHISDHGNMTLYDADDKEVWAVV